jgi:hypothetical protein
MNIFFVSLYAFTIVLITITMATYMESITKTYGFVCTKATIHEGKEQCTIYERKTK